MTVASGFTFHYPAGVRHIRYDLEDRKNENIGAHFDAAAAQIDRRTFTLKKTSKMAGFWCIAAQASPEYLKCYKVSNTSHCLPHQAQEHDFPAGLEDDQIQAASGVSQPRLLAAAEELRKTPPDQYKPLHCDQQAQIKKITSGDRKIPSFFDLQQILQSPTPNPTLQPPPKQEPQARLAQGAQRVGVSQKDGGVQIRDNQHVAMEDLRWGREELILILSVKHFL